MYLAQSFQEGTSVRIFLFLRPARYRSCLLLLFSRVVARREPNVVKLAIAPTNVLSITQGAVRLVVLQLLQQR